VIQWDKQGELLHEQEDESWMDVIAVTLAFVGCALLVIGVVVLLAP